MLPYSPPLLSVGLCNKSDEIQNTGWIGAWEVGEDSMQKFETQVNIWIGVENHIHVRKK